MTNKITFQKFIRTYRASDEELLISPKDIAAPFNTNAVALMIGQDGKEITATAHELYDAEIASERRLHTAANDAQTLSHHDAVRKALTSIHMEDTIRLSVTSSDCREKLTHWERIFTDIHNVRAERNNNLIRPNAGRQSRDPVFL